MMKRPRPLASNDTRRRFRRHGVRRKVCRFCADKIHDIDYKNVGLLQGYITDRGKILSARVKGTCARHQRLLKTAIRRARDIALLAYNTR